MSPRERLHLDNLHAARLPPHRLTSRGAEVIRFVAVRIDVLLPDNKVGLVYLLRCAWGYEGVGRCKRVWARCADRIALQSTPGPESAAYAAFTA